MNDKELVAGVTDELFWDPKVDGEAIAVTADSGVVRLRGTVGSFREKSLGGLASIALAVVLFLGPCKPGALGRTSPARLAGLT
ncbi:MAG: hypothetical protein ACTHMZ_01835, partial [Actinomycetes bacterium]